MANATRPAPASHTPVTHISGESMSPHLRRLLDVRERLARYATERSSHNLDDADDAFMAMVNVEDEIAAEAPKVHAALFPAWVTSCEEVAHEPGGYNVRCGICLARHPSLAPGAGLVLLVPLAPEDQAA